MKKELLFLMMLIALQTNAQGIKTTVIKEFQFRGNPNVSHTFARGDTVYIHAYKKYKDDYYFIVETEEYADLIKYYTTPFNVAILSYFLIICLILNYIAHIGQSIFPSSEHVSGHKYEPSKTVV